MYLFVFVDIVPDTGSVWGKHFDFIFIFFYREHMLQCSRVKVD
jgi:hypothetical protein